jgi:signal transduction histidine kinase
LARVAPAASAVGYRVAVEALTNVRRHSPGAPRVALSVGRAGGSIEVVVRNDPAPGRPSSTRSTGGSGLAGLRAQLHAVGGTLVAGPTQDHGWEVRALIPAEAP